MTLSDQPDQQVCFEYPSALLCPRGEPLRFLTWDVGDSECDGGSRGLAPGNLKSGDIVITTRGKKLRKRELGPQRQIVSDLPTGPAAALHLQGRKDWPGGAIRVCWGHSGGVEGCVCGSGGDRASQQTSKKPGSSAETLSWMEPEGGTCGQKAPVLLL